MCRVPGNADIVGGAPVTEIYSIGMLSAGSAFNMTVWSYVDQVDISILSDDETFDDVHEATDAMIHSLAEIRRAAGLPADLTTVDTAMAPVKARRLDVAAEYREPALLGQPVESRLHHLADMRIDGVDIGVLAELLQHIDRVQHLRNDLGR